MQLHVAAWGENVQLCRQHCVGIIGLMNKAGGPLISTAGLSNMEKCAIYRKVSAGKLLKLHPGVFIPPEERTVVAEPRLIQDIVAAAVAKPRSVVVGESAAFLHELARTTPRLSLHQHSSIDLGFTYAKHYAASDHRLARSLAFRRISTDEAERAVRIRSYYGSVRVASIPDTCFQLAKWVGLEEACVAAEDALHRQKVTLADFDSAGFIARKGAARYRQLRNLVTPWAESPRESELKLAMWHAGLPAPCQQVSIYEPGARRFLGRVDFMFPCGLIIEYDGASKYREPVFDIDGNYQGEETIAAELSRQKRIALYGYEFLRIDHATFTDGMGVKAIAERLDWLRQYPRDNRRWLWIAKGKAWKEPGDAGWLNPGGVPQQSES